ncbi:YybH family protein [Amycolatopsis sp. NPDC059021]|uniref:YybH family protein n=1 Tax=Amycolatopsis sp. NPDC059021 TaxID=3346704 RepID=UPI0036705D7F
MGGNDVIAEITGLIEARAGAVRAKDVAALLGQYAEDVVLFDAVGELRERGAAVERARLESWFGGYDGPITLRIKDIEVTASGEVAFAHYVFQVRGTMTDGTEVSMWVRSTVGFRAVDGVWRIVHEHSSVPFDAATGAALVDLVP